MFWRFALLSVGTLMFCFGCSSENVPGLGQVFGTITMDGKPISGATVTFEPTKGGISASLGRTDANGKYDLYYSRGHKGTPIGESVVRITSAGETGDEDHRVVRKETVPTKYNVKTELKADVKRGSNKFDFDLKGGGEIFHAGEEPKPRRSASGCS